MDECPTSESLVSYTLGLLDRKEFIETLGHVAKCANCRAATLTLQGVIRKLAHEHKCEKLRSPDVPKWLISHPVPRTIMSHAPDYASTIRDTSNHISRVQELIAKCVVQLNHRADVHDQSKLKDPELTGFATVSGKLKDVEYMSPKYGECMEELKTTLAHHYANNRHHPEHFHEEGYLGMNLIDLLEMICDWKAAGERHQNGSLVNSIELNQKRFGYSDELKRILLNTVQCLT